MARENKFQAQLIIELQDMFPGCMVLNTNGNYIQGFPDLLILYHDMWAALECKRSLNEPYQPNQEYYLDVMDDMSFASMICPENKKEVLYELQRSFSPRRYARISRC